MEVRLSTSHRSRRSADGRGCHAPPYTICAIWNLSRSPSARARRASSVAAEAAAAPRNARRFTRPPALPAVAVRGARRDERAVEPVGHVARLVGTVEVEVHRARAPVAGEELHFGARGGPPVGDAGQ